MPDGPFELPTNPSLTQLRKQAKERLALMRADQPAAKLADAQHLLAREYGFRTWATLVTHCRASDAAVGEPTITAPVSRHLGTKDIQAAISFWCDVLGFEESETTSQALREVTLGEASVRLGAHDRGPLLEGGPRAPGSAVVFFHTNDVEGLHALVRSRGGQPSELEKVNGLKMRVFEVRDPDEHALWFGQSYQRATPASPPAMIQEALPELPFSDVNAAARHYETALGFGVNHEEPGFAVMYRDKATILLIPRTERHGGIGSVFFYVKDVDALYAELLASGADLQGEPVSQPWGIRMFSVLDVEGNELGFGQTFE